MGCGHLLSAGFSLSPEPGMEWNSKAKAGSMCGPVALLILQQALLLTIKSQATTRPPDPLLQALVLRHKGSFSTSKTSDLKSSQSHVRS